MEIKKMFCGVKIFNTDFESSRILKNRLIINKGHTYVLDDSVLIIIHIQSLRSVGFEEWDATFFIYLNDIFGFLFQLVTHTQKHYDEITNIKWNVISQELLQNLRKVYNNTL